MSEQQVGRSPFAVIAELASVTVLAFYVYAYSFFHGFFYALDYDFISLFSTNDTISILAWSPAYWLGIFLISIVAALGMLGMVYYGYFMVTERMRKDADKAIKEARVTLILVCIFGFVGPIVLIVKAINGTLRVAQDMGGAWLVENAAVIGWNAVAIILMIFGEINRGRLAKYARLFAYILFLSALGISAHANGTFYVKNRLHEPASYCVDADNKIRETVRLIVASNQNALFQRADGRRMALSFNAIKSIRNSTCDMDDVIGAAPDCIKSDKMIQHALDVDLAKRVNGLSYIDDKRNNPKYFCYFASDAKEQIESTIASTEACVRQIASNPQIVSKGQAVSSKQSYEANRFRELLRKVTDYRNAQHCP